MGRSHGRRTLGAMRHEWHQIRNPGLEIGRPVKAAEYFGKNQIACQKILPTQQTVEALRFRRRRAVEVVDPDGAVYEQHRPAGLAFPAFAKIASPAQLAAITSDLLLLFQAHEKFEAAMHDFPLGLKPSEACRPAYEPIIEMDIGSHRQGCV